MTTAMPFFCIHCRSEIDSTFKACPYCGEAVTDFLRKYSDAPIDGKYRILARLGVGGMGEVYKVLHVHLNAIRVVKLMRATIEKDPGAHDRFLREARLATRIQHPNVATLFDFSTLEDGTRYMVWEYIEGTDLHEFLQARGPLAPRYAARLAIQALRGLDAIHRAGIIHRDISPENLMVTHDDEGGQRVKIIDLGIAKQWGDESESQTRTGMFVGKWKYCSPEHLGMLASGERIDGRADLYSFGIVLFEMLTGVPPFQADTPHGYVMLHASENPRPIAEVNPTVPASPELESLMLRALEKDRGRRFATAREFADALERILPVLADSPGAGQRITIAQATEEPTRISPAALVEAPEGAAGTVAETVRTESPAATVRVGPVEPAAPIVVSGKRHTGVLAAVAAAVVLAIGGGAWVAFSRHDAARERQVSAASRVVQERPAAATDKPAVAALLNPVRVRVALNAFPWANVTAITNLESRDTITLSAPIVTPAQVDLAPGRYEITFANPDFPTPLKRIAQLRAGDDQVLTVTFSDPATAPVPDFGVVR